MPGPPTPILGLTVPTVGGDANAWGTELNGDLVILDSLGAVAVVPVSSAYIATVPTSSETVLRVTTAGLVIPITLPNPSTIPNKVYTIKKLDAGTGEVDISVAGGATIDGQALWVLNNQYAFVRLYSNGSTYDVIGTG